MGESTLEREEPSELKEVGFQKGLSGEQYSFLDEQVEREWEDEGFLNKYPSFVDEGEGTQGFKLPLKGQEAQSFKDIMSFEPKENELPEKRIMKMSNTIGFSSKDRTFLVGGNRVSMKPYENCVFKPLKPMPPLFSSKESDVKIGAFAQFKDEVDLNIKQVDLVEASLLIEGVPGEILNQLALSYNFKLAGEDVLLVSIKNLRGQYILYGYYSNRPSTLDTVSILNKKGLSNSYRVHNNFATLMTTVSLLTS